MSIELKHLEGLIRLCEATDPDKLKKIRIKLVKYMERNKLGQLSPSDDAKLRKMWAQLNCGEPYPEIPSRISGAAEWSYPVLSFAALALLGIMVFLMRGHFTSSNKPHISFIDVYDFKANPDQNRTHVGNSSGYNDSRAISHPQKTLVFDSCIMDAIPCHAGIQGLQYSLMYAWLIVTGKSLDILARSGEFPHNIWAEFSDDNAVSNTGLEWGYISNQLEEALRKLSGKWSSATGRNLDELRRSSKEWIISVEGRDETKHIMEMTGVAIVKKGAFMYLIDAHNRWAEITEGHANRQLADGAGIFVTFRDAQHVEDFIKIFYPEWKGYDVAITYLEPQ